MATGHPRAVHAALWAAHAKDRVGLFRALDPLVASPYTKGNFSEEDETGRPIEVPVAEGNPAPCGRGEGSGAKKGMIIGYNTRVILCSPNAGS